MIDRLCLVAICAGVIAVSGCQTAPLQLTDEQQKIRNGFSQIKPAEDSLATGTRIIDIHTHTFNARYLPLRGILLGKRDVAPPFSWLISDHCAGVLAQLLIDRTELSPAAGESGISRTFSSRKMAFSLK